MNSIAVLQLAIMLISHSSLHTFTGCSIVPEKSSPQSEARNYGNSPDAPSYYATYTGSYGSQPGTFSDQFNPSDYYPQVEQKKKPSVPTYSTYPGSYYPQGPVTSIECHEQIMGGIIGDVLQSPTFGNMGLLRSIVAALTAAVLTKIPIILAVKALIVKLILIPMGFLVLSLPFIIPIMFLFSPLWSRLKESFFGTTTTAPPTMMVMVTPTNATNQTGPKTRALNYGEDILTAVVQSDRCFEKVACTLGLRDANTSFTKPILWLLKFIQDVKYVQNNTKIKSTLKRYRDAYLQGVGSRKNLSDEADTSNAQAICTDHLYPCNTPNLYSKPEFVRFSRYL